MTTNRAARHLSALARCAAVLREYEAGESYAVIGKRLGVTRQRAGAMASYGRLMRELATANAEPPHYISPAMETTEDAAWDRFAQEQVTPTTEG